MKNIDPNVKHHIFLFRTVIDHRESEKLVQTAEEHVMHLALARQVLKRLTTVRHIMQPPVVIYVKKPMKIPVTDMKEKVLKIHMGVRSILTMCVSLFVRRLIRMDAIDILKRLTVALLEQPVNIILIARLKLNRLLVGAAL